ncbi:MAG: fibronectin type III domain-containing protein [Coriobacteriia bacterium]|nr:fibronectin type III domain-containing protein [Coriobacteriia bacterium]
MLMKSMARKTISCLAATALTLTMLPAVALAAPRDGGAAASVQIDQVTVDATMTFDGNKAEMVECQEGDTDAWVKINISQDGYYSFRIMSTIFDEVNLYDAEGNLLQGSQRQNFTDDGLDDRCWAPQEFKAGESYYVNGLYKGDYPSWQVFKIIGERYDAADTTQWAERSIYGVIGTDGKSALTTADFNDAYYFAQFNPQKGAVDKIYVTDSSLSVTWWKVVDGANTVVTQPEGTGKFIMGVSSAKDGSPISSANFTLVNKYNFGLYSLTADDSQFDATYEVDETNPMTVDRIPSPTVFFNSAKGTFASPVMSDIPELTSDDFEFKGFYTYTTWQGNDSYVSPNELDTVELPADPQPVQADANGYFYTANTKYCARFDGKGDYQGSLWYPFSLSSKKDISQYDFSLKKDTFFVKEGQKLAVSDLSIVTDADADMYAIDGWCDEAGKRLTSGPSEPGTYGLVLVGAGSNVGEVTLPVYVSGADDLAAYTATWLTPHADSNGAFPTVSVKSLDPQLVVDYSNGSRGVLDSSKYKFAGWFYELSFFGSSYMVECDAEHGGVADPMDPENGPSAPYEGFDDFFDPIFTYDYFMKLVPAEGSGMVGEKYIKFTLDTQAPACSEGFDHDFVVVQNDFDCTTAGKKISICKDCGQKKEEAAKASGHAFAAGKTVDATCTEAGYRELVCERCDATSKEEIDQAAGHQYKCVKTVAATCSAQGYKLYQCTTCKTTKKGSLTAKLSHKYGSLKISKAATASKACTMCKHKVTYTIAKRGAAKLTVKGGKKLAVSWGKTGYATKYVVYYKVKGAKSYKKITTTKQSTTLSKLSKGKKYQVMVVAYRGTAKMATGPVNYSAKIK